ncbi:MAG: dihydrodipicolinate synthase family protein [Pseudomonadota bacterium]
MLSGDDATTREAIGNGAGGVISVTANVAPAAMAQMVAHRAGRRTPRSPLPSMRDWPACTRTCSLEANPFP